MLENESPARFSRSMGYLWGYPQAFKDERGRGELRGQKWKWISIASARYQGLSTNCRVASLLPVLL
jgi:hypothetical protein